MDLPAENCPFSKEVLGRAERMVGRIGSALAHFKEKGDPS